MKTFQADYECPPPLDIEQADSERKWFLALGIITIVFGLAAIAMPAITTIAAILLLGSLLFVSGIFQLIQNFRVSGGREEFIHFVMSLLYIVAGALMILDPFLGAASVVILMSGFLVVGGVLRIIGSATSLFRNRGWMLFNGIVSLVLGFLILEGWPFSGLWVIGLFVGIEMVIYGWTLVMFSAAEREEIRQIRLHCEASA